MKKLYLLGLVFLLAGICEAANYANCTKLLPADATAAINATTDVTATAVSVNTKIDQHQAAALYLYVKGDNASCAGTITFTFQRSTDGDTWHDLPAVTVTMSGTSQVTDSSTTKDLDLTNTRFFRISKVANSETVSGRTAKVNAYIHYIR